MLNEGTFGQTVFPIVSGDSPSIYVGSLVYLEKYKVGTPLGLLLAITSPGLYQKSLKTLVGLAPIL